MRAMDVMTTDVITPGVGDFASRRQFLFDDAEKITFADDNVTIHGSVPINVPARSGRALASAETGKLEFRISDRITPRRSLLRDARPVLNSLQNHRVFRFLPTWYLQCDST
jgi:hypothetical protein